MAENSKFTIDVKENEEALELVSSFKTCLDNLNSSLIDLYIMYPKDTDFEGRCQKISQINNDVINQFIKPSYYDNVDLEQLRHIYKYIPIYLYYGNEDLKSLLDELNADIGDKFDEFKKQFNIDRLFSFLEDGRQLKVVKERLDKVESAIKTALPSRGNKINSDFIDYSLLPVISDSDESNTIEPRFYGKKNTELVDENAIKAVETVNNYLHYINPLTYISMIDRIVTKVNEKVQLLLDSEKISQDYIDNFKERIEDQKKPNPVPENSTITELKETIQNENLTIKELKEKIQNENLKTVSISPTVTSIGNSGLSHCKSLTQLIIPPSVRSIWHTALSHCKSLTQLEIPPSVTSIWHSALSHCRSLTHITIPTSVTTIEKYTFDHCSSLTQITIPSSVKSIPGSPFRGCTSLKNILVDSNNSNFISKDGILFTKNEHTLICYPAGKEETAYTIPSSVASIDVNAFSYCGALSQITIPSSVTFIGAFAFYKCASLAQITIPSSVTSIENSTFSDCTSLTQIIIPPSVTSIGQLAFDNCTSLTQITIPSSVTSMGYSTFFNCTSLTQITILSSIVVIPKCTFQNCISLAQIAIPSSVTSIGQYAFFNCTSLTQIAIPTSVESIGSNAFFHCNSLTQITIPSSVKSIGDHVFGSCSKLPPSVRDELKHRFNNDSLFD